MHFLLDSIVSFLDITFCDPENRIISYQDVLDVDSNKNFMYFIYSGHVHATMIYEDRLSSSKTDTRKLHEGTYFGEISLICESPRTLTIETHNNCIIA